MDQPQKEERNASFDLWATLVTSEGRHHVRIFGLPSNRLVMVLVASILLGMPFAFILAMMPFWDRVGDFSVLKQLNSYVAPALDSLTYDYRGQGLPRFPLKRFLIASTSMLELIFLANFFALFVRGVRKHALLVWMCYDRQKILVYFFISGLAFFALWFVFFSDWTILGYLSTGHGSDRVATRLEMYSIIAMPIVTFIFGHMATIVGLGLWRTAARKLKQSAVLKRSHLSSSSIS
jgi:hypothetical protein